MKNSSFRFIFFFVLSFILPRQEAFCQTDTLIRKKGVVSWFKKIYSDEYSDPKKSKFLVYPTFAFSPETSWEIGVSGLNLFYAKNDTNNRLSEINSFTFYTLNSQFGTFLEHFVYTDKDHWVFLGKLKAQRFPLLYYGVGPNTEKTNEQLITADYISLRERVLKKVTTDFFGGLEADFQNVSNTGIEESSNNTEKIPGINGTNYLGLGLGLVYDTRHNPLNVRSGIYAEIANLNYGYVGGGDEKFSSLQLDFRYYNSIKKNQVLAVQLLGQFVSGNPPFNLLPQLGGENIMRGYYIGRYRDNNLLAAQIEYRILPFSFSKRIGAVVFVGAGTVSPSVQDFSTNNIKATAGLGLRYLIFPKKDIFVRFDTGFTREGNAFYIFSGEAF